MPWQLTTPISVGDLDPNGPYQQVKIRYMIWDDRRSSYILEWEYGNTISEEWVSGKTPSGKETTTKIYDQNYIDLNDHVTNDGEKTRAAVKRGLYEYLFTKGLIDPGTVVDS